MVSPNGTIGSSATEAQIQPKAKQNMRAVLGIDAAWTDSQPSGVALVAESTAGWKLLAVASSYEQFCAPADRAVMPKLRPKGSAPNVSILMRTCFVLLGQQPVDMVAIDMPVSRAPITGRRASDNAISEKYGSRWASTHSPSALRPGPLSDILCRDFADAGYDLKTTAMSTPALIEVYPHPALIELSKAPRRLPYKASNSKKYWPDLDPNSRKLALIRQWIEIVSLLDVEIGCVAEQLPQLHVKASAAELKAYEDALDAVVCAWVGTCALEGRATPFGDHDSAIWVPNV